jgi:hypothetical protein
VDDGAEHTDQEYERAGQRVPIRCGTRRRHECEPCSDLYAGDVRTVAAAIPDTSAALFLTLTAPGFGTGHHQATARRKCHPNGYTCPTCGEHVRCGRLHRKGDSVAGAPLHAGCLDYASMAAWQLAMPALWSETNRRIQRWCRDHGYQLSYLRVGEAQARGAMHVHVLMVTDAPADDVRRIAQAATVPAGFPLEHARWGEQTRCQSLPALTGDQDADNRARKQRSKAATYLSKYVAKDVADPAVFAGGSTETVVGAHLARLRHAVAWSMAGSCTHQSQWPRSRGALEHHQRRPWIFCRYCRTIRRQLGFRGHVLTRSHTWPESLTACRQRREVKREADRLERGEPPTTCRVLLVDNVGIPERGPPIDWRAFELAHVAVAGAGALKGTELVIG